MRPLEIWGGIEATVNRVGDDWFDQVERTGHAVREADLELFAGLGLTTLRYPLLWERIAPEVPDSPDWTWTDRRLAAFRRLGMKPVAGLCHHGSGPAYAGLLDEDFAPGLARFAGEVARRYPWITDYTPVNEPLTTARFAGLYGLWHPHRRDPFSFGRAFLNQCRATVLAMEAIRQVNRGARLVQTEDLGKTFATAPLAYQAEFENERRWLTFDLLLGRVNRDHPMWGYLSWAGIPEAELTWFQDHPLPPDIVGINHYITSERFLDHRLDRYAASLHGGNGQDRYADVEAVRVLAAGAAGPRRLLGEAWERYRLPLAVTEAHLNCTREEQLRWLYHVWTAARELQAEGVDVRAVTAWSLLGAYDWANLLTRPDCHYEPGVFDLRSQEPRPTALAGMIRELAATGDATHPVLDSPGWWQKESRLLYDPACTSHHGPECPAPAVRRHRARPLLITGAQGTLGRAFARISEARGLEKTALSRQELDIADRERAGLVLDQIRPWAIINAAGYVRVDDAETEPARCFRENVEGPEILAGLAADRGIRFLTYSSDLVFDGCLDRLYLEDDVPAPLNVYGRSKAESERRVLAILPAALVIRTSAFFGPWDSGNFPAQLVRAGRNGRSFAAAGNLTVTPTYVPDLVNASLDLLIDAESGLWHVTHEEPVTWLEFARRVARRAGLPEAAIERLPAEETGFQAARPASSGLASARGHFLPPLDAAIEAFVRDADIFREDPESDLLATANF